MGMDMGKGLDIFMTLGYPEDFTPIHPEPKALVREQRAWPATAPETAERTTPEIMSINAYDRLPQIKCPLLIVQGNRDLLVPVESAHIIKD
jgi:pimeloyl-ACP methyl ester carboxylesterase